MQKIQDKPLFVNRITKHFFSKIKWAYFIIISIGTKLLPKLNRSNVTRPKKVIENDED